MGDYSQDGEQEKLINVFDKIGIKYKVSVEFGAPDFISFSNTKFFMDDGWDSKFIDNNPKVKGILKRHMTVDNINNIFDNLELPFDFDLLSIDVDGNDYWIWKALLYTPRVVVIEFNPCHAKNLSLTIKYDENFVFNKTRYFGASFTALEKLGKEKGYKLVDATGLNMIFVLDEICDEYGLSKYEGGYISKSGWKVDLAGRTWVKV